MRIENHAVDIFLCPRGPQDAICVTTNGVIRSDGRAVMGAGIAKQADDRFDLTRALAASLRRQGNHVFCFGPRTDIRTDRVMTVFAFPTKEDWKAPSILSLIIRSAHELVEQCDKLGIKTCYMTPPGCGLGRLDWTSQVRPALKSILDDRFVVIVH